MKKYVAIATLLFVTSAHAHMPTEVGSYSSLYIDQTLEVIKQACSKRIPKTAPQWENSLQNWRRTNQFQLEQLAKIANELENAAINRAFSPESNENLKTRFGNYLLIQNTKALAANVFNSSMAQMPDTEAEKYCAVSLDALIKGGWPSTELEQAFKAGIRLLDEEKKQPK